MGILSSIAVLANRLIEASQSEQEMIPLIPASAYTVTGTEDQSALQAPTQQQNSAALLTNYSPVVVSDNEQAWGTQTDIEVFKLSYENGTGEISVLSSNEDKVIAPGTDNEYTFRIKNNSSAPIKYKMTCEVVTEPQNLFFPVEMSLKSNTGNYFFGSEDALENVENISRISDSATLSANNYAYYTLNWQWPFEWGNDEYDTYLGNRAVDEDLTVTVIIKTIAEWDLDSDRPGGGLMPPKTGDTTNIALFIVISVVCLIIIIILIFKKRRPEDDLHDEDTDQN